MCSERPCKTTESQEGGKAVQPGTKEAQPGQNCVLKVQNLTVVLANRTIIDNLSFTVAKGESLTVVGPNGAGKTVLLKSLLGLLPHTGTVEWNRHIKVGYVPQRLPFIREIPMTVRDFFNLKGHSADTRDEVIGSMDFPRAMLDSQVGALSSGQFQKVLIAWSILGKPNVLLFDEPTTGVDIAGEETVYALLEKLQRERGLTMLLVTHDLSIVYRFSTSVLCLNRHLVCFGPPNEVLTPESLRELYGAEIKYYRHTHD
ncbi:MAG TPA: ABC transporter ATP-binding protein [Deltaproteobacteria bacterium]|nr:ABC transporter ATP-binding protein [Deltaproteobacteria bacterium]